MDRCRSSPPAIAGSVDARSSGGAPAEILRNARRRVTTTLIATVARSASAAPMEASALAPVVRATPTAAAGSCARRLAASSSVKHGKTRVCPTPIAPMQEPLHGAYAGEARRPRPPRGPDVRNERGLQGFSRRTNPDFFSSAREFTGELDVPGRQLPAVGEGANDLDADLDCTRALERGREHGHAVRSCRSGDRATWLRSRGTLSARLRQLRRRPTTCLRRLSSEMPLWTGRRPSSRKRRTRRAGCAR